jgi:putative oxidoreductase
MNVVFIIGRIALVVLFILSGAGKLLDIPGTAAMIDSKFAMPSFLTDYANQLSQAVNMPMSNILAIVLGVIEFVAALLVAVGVLARTAAVVLIIFTVVTVFCFYDFWNAATGADRTNLITHALESLSVIGGLLMLVGLPRRLVHEEYAPPEHLAPL